MMIYIYKLIYFIRKKLFGFKLKYLLNEHQHLHPKRFLLNKIHISKFPDCHFDDSNSKLIINKNTAIRGDINFTFINNGIIDIGENCFFNNNCSINCLESIKIGSDCLFGENVKLYDHNHEYKLPGKLVKDQGYNTAPISIGNNCWFGSNVTILKGVNIGSNCVIGANCVVFKDVPNDSIVTVNAENQLTKTISRLTK